MIQSKAFVLIILFILLSFNPSSLAQNRIFSIKELVKDFTKTGNLNGVILIAEYETSFFPSHYLR